MNDIILKYLNTNFRLNGYSSIKDYRLFDIVENKVVSPRDVVLSLKDIFGVEVEEILDIVGPWFENKVIELQNKVTDIHYKAFELTGIELTFTLNQLNKLLEYDGIINHTILNNILSPPTTPV